MSITSEKNILVVDNNPVIVKLMTELLKGKGHHVRSAADVFTCLDILSEWTPDIIYLDLIMPRIGGDDLCRIIRGRAELKHCYLVIVSGAVLEQAASFLDFGADEYIAKGPFKEMTVHIMQAIENSVKRPVGHEKQIKGGEELRPRQVTRELLEQNHHFKITLDSISQGIVEIELDRVVFINAQAQRFLGIQKENLLGCNYHEALPASVQSALEAVDDPDDYSRFTVYQPAVKIGDRQLVVETLNSGKVGNTILMLTDVTERKKMEAVIEATNLTENLGFIFSGIRHEIGNPINSIKMALSVLLRNLETYDQATVEDFVSRSLDEVVRIEYLLTALKNYSLFESPITEQLSVLTFFENFLSLIQNDLQQKNIEIEVQVEDETLMVLADSRALHHVMLNLITNAADAVEGVSDGKVIITANRSDGRVEIKVSDNGKGILPDDQKYLFKPFFTSKVKGTGLGLVNVRKMLIAMKGSVDLQSYPGRGTIVSVILPGVDNA